jgi:hypothetical protein
MAPLLHVPPDVDSDLSPDQVTLDAVHRQAVHVPQLPWLGDPVGTGTAVRARRRPAGFKEKVVGLGELAGLEPEVIGVNASGRQREVPQVVIDLAVCRHVEPPGLLRPHPEVLGSF